jgi:hypothetical protein
VDTYRAGLFEAPGSAWKNALAVMGDVCPEETEAARVKILLLSLGFWGFDVDWRDLMASEPLGPDTRWPCLLSGYGTMTRAGTAATAFGMTTDELVSRVFSAWMDAACDFDGSPLDGIARP